MPAAQTNRELIYRMTADPTGFTAGTKSAAASAKALDRVLSELETRQRKVHRTLTQLGYVTGAIGAAIASGMYMAARAAIEWETAWTGVLKTVDATPAQFALLEDQIRGLTHVLPASHTEIAGVAEAAGQLGIAVGDIDNFTRTMVDLGVSTNLAAGDAAMALGRLMNIMGTSPDDVRRLGSSLVDLGNRFASTEAEITEMSLRIAGAGATIGLSESDVLGFATALSSVGVYAEAGGSAISRVFIKIDEAVRSGGAKLDEFAKVAGMTSAEFVTAYGNDPAAAIDRFVQGLGRMQTGGANVFATLKDLGLAEIRTRDSLLRLASAGDLLSRTLDVGQEAWDENLALTTEAERRYGTTASQIQIATNRIRDFAIDMGGVLLPAIATVAGAIGELATWFQGLPGWAQTSLIVLGSLAVVVTGVGTAALIAIPKIIAFKTAVDGLSGGAARMLQRALGGITSMLTGPWGIALGAAAVALTVLGVVLASNAASSAELRSEIEELSQTLDKLTGDVTHDTELWVANKLAKEGILASARKVGVSEADLTRAILGNATAIERVNAALDAQREKREAVGSGKYITSVPADAEDRQAVEDALAQYSDELAQAKELQDQINAAMGEGEQSAESLTGKQKALAETFAFTGDEAKAATSEIDDLKKALDEVFEVMFGAEEAEDAVAGAFNDLKDGIEKNGKALTGNSEAALDNRDKVRNLIKAYYDMVKAQADAGASAETLNGLAKSLKEQFIEQMRSLGMAEEEIQRYAASFDEIPSEVSTLLVVDRKIREWGVWTSQDDFHKKHGMAGGGWVSGPGGPRDDRVPAWLSDGEFVVSAAPAARYAGLLEAINNGRIPVFPTSTTSPAGPTIVNHYYSLDVKAFSDRFSLDQVQREIRFRTAV